MRENNAKEEEEEEVNKAYMRVIHRMTEGLDTAACVAVMMGLDRKIFTKAASSAFDFIQRWHDANREGK